MQREITRPVIVVAAPGGILPAVIAYLLGGMGAEVRLLHSGEALKRLEAPENCPLILSSFLTPLLDGCDFARRIRGPHAYPKIWLLSWLHSEQTVLSLLEGGADQYFSLPVNLNRLKIKIAECLSAWRRTTW